MYRRAQRTRVLWDDALIDAISRPLSALIWILGISLAASVIHTRTDAVAFDFVPQARSLAVIAVVAWFAVRFVHGMEESVITKRAAAGEPVDRTTVEAIGKLLRASIIITAALVGMQSFGISITGVLTFGGVGGLAVGFAAKDMLANFFGGLTIYLDRPFAVGDWVRSPDREIEGTVEQIGWRRTVIRTFELRPIYVPNAAFTNITVENPSRMSNRRIFETIGLRYDDIAQMPAVLEDVRAMLKTHDEVDQSRTLMVNFTAFGASSLDMFIYVFTRTRVWTEYHMVKEEILLKIADIVASHGAEIAFPTRTLHMPEGLLLQDGRSPESGA
jgi:MscS family membrane protein